MKKNKKKNHKNASPRLDLIPSESELGLEGYIGFYFAEWRLHAIYHNEALATVRHFAETMSAKSNGVVSSIVYKVMNGSVKLVETHCHHDGPDGPYLFPSYNLLALLLKYSLEAFALCLVSDEDDFAAYCEQIFSERGLTLINADGWPVDELAQIVARQSVIEEMVAQSEG